MKKNINKGKMIFGCFFAALSLTLGALGAADAAVGDEISVFSGERYAAPAFMQLEGEVGGFRTSTSSTLSVFGINLKTVNVSVYQNVKLIPGGQPFGVRLSTRGVLVVGMTEVETAGGRVNPSYSCGIRVKDVITKINGSEINTAAELTEAVESCGGRALSITYLHEGNEKNTSLIPALDKADGVYKAGVWVRDSTAGIGTVTFISPDTGAFGGLGHGICDGDTGELMTLLHGTVSDVKISGIEKGSSGSPGEIRGFFSGGQTGQLFKNTNSGVFGVLNELPENLPEPVPIALKGSVHSGAAELICTTAENVPTKYDIEIIKVSSADSETKNFIIAITDERLLAKTGGIVQGMSGSPVIQDGCLIGAVTHVMINDPSKGYGIFIENMLGNLKQTQKAA